MNKNIVIEVPIINSKFERFKEEGVVRFVLSDKYLERSFDVLAETFNEKTKKWEDEVLVNNNIIARDFIKFIDLDFDAELGRWAVSISDKLYTHFARKEKAMRFYHAIKEWRFAA